MRTSEGAFASIVQTDDAGTLRYLVQWNAGWNAFNFVGGRVEPSESFRACCVREIAEELGLQENIGYHVSERPLAHLEYTAYSASAQQETAYVFELFETRLSAAAERQVTNDPANLWVDVEEILAGQSRDGRSISRTVAEVLGRAGLLIIPGESGASAGVSPMIQRLDA